MTDLAFAVEVHEKGPEAAGLRMDTFNGYTVQRPGAGKTQKKTGAAAAGAAAGGAAAGGAAAGAGGGGAAPWRDGDDGDGFDGDGDGGGDGGAGGGTGVGMSRGSPVLGAKSPRSSSVA